MTPFAIYAAVLALLAIAFASWTLWRTSRVLALTLVFGLPLAAAGLYHLKGQPAALNPQLVEAPKTIEDAVAQLQARVAAEPENLEGLVLLARSYMAMEKFELARDNFAKAMQLQPENVDLSVEYAEALLRASQDHRFPPDAVVMLEKAIAQDPVNQRALFFLGTHRMQENQPAEALALWERLLPLLDPATAAALRKQVEVVRLAAGMTPLPLETAATDASATGSAASLNIKIQIDPKLAGQITPGSVVYVFARATEAAGPPLAAKRIPLGQLPLEVQLSDADSPMPAARLSSQKEVMLIARLSRTGDARAASGDIESEPLKVASNEKNPITLTLSRSVP